MLRPHVAENLYHACHHWTLWSLTAFIVLFDTDCSAFVQPSRVWLGEICNKAFDWQKLPARSFHNVHP